MTHFSEVAVCREKPEVLEYGGYYFLFFQRDITYTTIERTLRFAVECEELQQMESSEIVFPKTISALAETHRRQLDQLLNKTEILPLSKKMNLF